MALYGKGWLTFALATLAFFLFSDSQNLCPSQGVCSCWSVYSFLFFGYVTRHVGPWFPGQGSNLRPLHRKDSVLTTGPPGFFLLGMLLCFTLHTSTHRSEHFLSPLTLWMLITSAISKYLLIHLFLPLECKLLEGTALSYHLGSTWHIAGAL